MRKIATIGFGKKSAERFVALLRSAGVTTVIDTRRRPDSPLSGYARKRDLPFLLRQAAGIGYEHWLQLAPPDDLLQEYRELKDWPRYVDEFEARVLATREAQDVMGRLLERDDIVALLCSEPTPDRCHRRLVVERMQQMDPRLEIVHLV